MVTVPCRVEELSKTLSQQYDVAAELKRNLEAETTLHTHNVSCNLSSCTAIYHHAEQYVVRVPYAYLFKVFQVCYCVQGLFSQRSTTFVPKADW